MTAFELALWAADAFAGYDVASTHRIVSAATGSGPLPDHVSPRVDPFTSTVALPRPVGVVLARVSPDGLGSTALLDAVVRRVLLTRNALLVEAVPPPSTAADGDLAGDAWHAAVESRVHVLAALAVEAGAPAGVLQMLDGPASPDAVLEPAHDAPIIVIVDGSGTGADPDGSGAAADPDAHVIAGLTLEHAIRVARGVLRETGGDRIRVRTADPDVPLRVAAALPVTRVAVNDLEMPPSTPDGLLTWTRVTVDQAAGRPPWTPPAGPLPVCPRASNEVS